MKDKARNIQTDLLKGVQKLKEYFIELLEAEDNSDEVHSLPNDSEQH